MVVARTPTRSAPTPSAAARRVRHRRPKRRDARLLADHHAIGVDEREACLAHLPVRLGEQLDRVRAPVALVVGGEERADVREPGGAEQGSVRAWAITSPSE